MFPLKSTRNENRSQPSATIDEALDDKVREITANIRLARIIPDGQERDANGVDGAENSREIEDTTPRPGISYRIYKTEADLPKTARKFYETSASLSGLSLKTIVTAVYRIELKLENLQYDVRRAETYGEAT